MNGNDMDAAGPARRGFLYWLDHLEAIVAGIALVLSFIAVLIGIVSREFLAVPVVWSEELARLAFVYVVFIGMSEAYARSGHLRVEITDLLFSRRLMLLLRIVTQLMIGGLALVLFWYGWQQAARSHMLQSLILSWPLSITYAALPIAALLMALRTPFMIWREIQALRSC